MRLLRSW